MAYQPIENYGIIGNMRTTALVGMNGAIDWLCYPRFDSPSVFAAILDHQKGGHFRIEALADDVSHKQFYWPETNVLVTRFLSNDGVGQLVDYMPVTRDGETGDHHAVVRQLHVVRGRMRFRLECFPAFDYGRTPHETALVDGGAVFTAPDLSLGLATDAPLEVHERGIASELVLEEGDTAAFVLRGVDPGSGCGPCLSADAAEDLFRSTVAYWRRWIAGCTYTGRWREMVHRSALALKLLTYEPTGAIVAAATTSLPEGPGRRAQLGLPLHLDPRRAFTLYGLHARRLHQEAAATSCAGSRQRMPRARDPDGSLQIMYGIDGRHELPEETLDHLEGYKRLEARCASATARTASSSSTSTASCSTRSTCTTSTRNQIGYDRLDRQLRRLDRLRLRALAAARTKASGRCAAAAEPLRLLQADVLGGAGPRPSPRAQALACRPITPTLAVWCATMIYEEIMDARLEPASARPSCRAYGSRQRWTPPT